jgi:hypothetical protein
MPKLIVTLPVTGLNLLGVGGQKVLDTHRQLRSQLGHLFGPEYALLLASPHRDGSGPIDWYTPEDLPEGESRQLTTLPEPEQRRIRTELEAKLDDVRKKAAELMASRDDRQIKLGERLEKATSFPDDRFIFVVGDKPVIVCWGTRSERADNSVPALEKDIGPFVPRNRMQGTAQDRLDTSAGSVGVPAPPPEPPSVILLRTPFPWGVLLAMLALFLFLGGIVLSLVPACGVNGVLSPWSWRNVWCDVVAASDAPNSAETDELQAELDRLRSAIAATPCPAPPPPPRPPEPAPLPRLPSGWKTKAGRSAKST